MRTSSFGLRADLLDLMGLILLNRRQCGGGNTGVVNACRRKRS